MGRHERNEACGSVGVAFISGVVLGAVAAVLFAPQSGETTRRVIRGYARRKEEDILERAGEIRSQMSETIEEGKRFLNETKGTIASAFEAAKAAFKKEMANRGSQ
jgi:gas vesicle protein